MTLIFKDTPIGYFGNLYFDLQDFTDFITTKGKPHCWKHMVTIKRLLDSLFLRRRVYL